MPIHGPGQLQKTRAEKHYEPIIPRLLELVKQGYNQPEIADILNREGFTTLKGYPYHQVAVHRLIKRAEKLPRIGTATGAALAQQANIAAKQQTGDDDLFAEFNRKREHDLEMISRVQREENAKLEQAIEFMKSNHL